MRRETLWVRKKEREAELSNSRLLSTDRFDMAPKLSASISKEFGKCRERIRLKAERKGP
jgi:hypothetical protein